MSYQSHAHYTTRAGSNIASAPLIYLPELPEKPVAQPHVLRRKVPSAPRGLCVDALNLCIGRLRGLGGCHGAPSVACICHDPEPPPTRNLPRSIGAHFTGINVLLAQYVRESSARVGRPDPREALADKTRLHLARTRGGGAHRRQCAYARHLRDVCGFHHMECVDVLCCNNCNNCAIQTYCRQLAPTFCGASRGRVVKKIPLQGHDS
eukprot:5048557-Pyramimonas_sp.AAC.1